MSLAERNVWVALVTTPLVVVVYLAVIVSRAWSTPVEEVSWVVPMIWATGTLIVVAIVSAILAAIVPEVSSEIGAAVRDAIAAETARKQAGDAGPGEAAVTGSAKATRHHPIEADERDKLIEQHGYLRAGMVATFGALVAIALSMLRLDHFWIAHTLFAAIVLGNIYGAITRAIAYRRGI